MVLFIYSPVTLKMHGNTSPLQVTIVPLGRNVSTYKSRDQFQTNHYIHSTQKVSSSLTLLI